MNILDAHVHVGRPKYPDLDEYLAAMDRVGIAGAVLVQHVGNTDNGYLGQCLAAHPARFAAIGLVDTDAVDAPAQVSRLAAAGFTGLRLWAASRSPGPDPLAIWRAAARSGLVASVRGPFADIVDPRFAALLDAVPDLVVRLEHLGFFRYGVDHGFDDFLRLADRPGTYAMWSGYYANSLCPFPYADALPFLRRALAAFGPERVMWSGDWNRQTHHAVSDTEYQAAIRHLTALPFLSTRDIDWILGRTTASLFGLRSA